MRIGAVADATGVTPKTIRYYESIGLIPDPPRTAAGYRDYGSDVISRLEFIRCAQRSGLTLRDIGSILTIRDGGQAPCEHVAELLDARAAQVESRIRELERTRTELRTLARRAATLDVARCRDVDICHIISGASP